MDPIVVRTRLNYASGHRSPPVQPVDVTVGDARQEALPDWSTTGFQLVAHASAVHEWDDEEIRGVHYAELEQLAREMTGCDHALVTGHIVRGPRARSDHPDLAPIEFVHSDFAAGHGALLRSVIADPTHAGVTASLARHGASRTVGEVARRIVVLQFWRNLGPARMDLPMAFCDARSVRPEDGVSFAIEDYGGSGGPTFEGLAIKPPSDPERHRWFWFPELRADEVVAFRTYDSDLVDAGQVYFTPHAAFRDPSVRRGEPARSSIELRATCLYI